MLNDSIKKVLQQVEKDLAGCLYRDIDIYGVVKIPLYTAMRRQMQKKSLLWQAICGIYELIFFIRFWAERLTNNNKSRDINWLDNKAVFVFDYRQKNLIQFQEDIIEKMNVSNLSVFTKNNKIRKILLEDMPELDAYDVSDLCKKIKLELSDLKFVWMVNWKLDKLSLNIRIAMINALFTSILYVKFYNALFANNNVKALVTLCDTHSQEHAAACVAKYFKIPTFTLQHGMIGVLYAPVVSDYIFVWGDTSKKELMALGVPNEKIIVAGRPGLDKKVKQYTPKLEYYRNEFAVKYNMDLSKPIITYFTTNWGEKENYLLLKTFLCLQEINVNLLIKLQPHINNRQRKQYNRWLKELVSNDNVTVLDGAADMYDIFAATDILVTCHSGSAVEAMPFSVVSVILDILPYMKLKTILPHYNDCVVINNEEMLKTVISELAINKERLDSLKMKAIEASNKYYINSTGGSAAETVASFIRRCIS